MIQNITSPLARLGAGLAITLAGALASWAPAQAGQPCESRPMSLYEMERGLELAANTANTLNAQDRDVAIIARVGQNLRAYGQRYSHIAFVTRTVAPDGQATSWRVVHKLNECGTDSAHLYRQGLAEFFSDDLYEWEAAVVPLAPEIAGKVKAVLDDPKRIARLHTRSYNMLAYPWSTRYQQSNQWVLETLAMAIEPDIGQRDQAQAWLKFKGYHPDTLTISTFQRLGARITRANVAFDDHPSGQRFADRITTTTADSALRWLQASRLGEQKISVR